MGCSSLLPSPASSALIVSSASCCHRWLWCAHAIFGEKSLPFEPLPLALRPARMPRIMSGGIPKSSIADGALVKERAIDAMVHSTPSPIEFAESMASSVEAEAQKRKLEKKELRKKSERTIYLLAALASSVGITFLTAGAVYYRFAWQTQGAEVPLLEIFGTFSLAVGASVGMEFWARWAHQALWHDSLWSMHESHHRPRDGPFELNDIFAIINAVPAIALMAYGFFHKGLIPGLCFGAGLGITVFGIAYMFVHDGLVHRRFPVGPTADVPYFQKVAAAHQLHHADKFKGVPYGLFLGPNELEALPGGAEELEKMMEVRKKLLIPKQ